MRTLSMFVLLLNWSGTQVNCLSAEELKLYHLINEYRKTKGLPVIALSPSLSRVAALHARDLAENNPITDRCNLHSWSDKGNWTPCCYTDDHKAASCMWNKPRELTDYTGDGFEIAYFHSGGATADAALEAWKGSEGHHDVIINRGIWQRISWKAIGVGISQNYALVWFGFEADSENCD